MKLNKSTHYAILIIVLLCLVSRMPQLLSENLLLDGDESILGLMSKHFLEFKEVPFFFYGQSYGFSFVEVFIIGLFYLFFGVSAIAVKLAMLTLWTLGIVFFYKTLKEINFKNNQWIPLLITLVFIFSPSFAVWSMKARGGYLTAFFLTSMVTFLLFNKTCKLNLWASFFVGLLLIIIYQAQPLWLAGLIPLVIFQVLKKQNLRYGLIGVSAAIVGILSFYFLKLGLPTFWSPKVLDWPTFSLDAYSSIIDRMYIFFTGNFYYGEFKEAIFITKILAVFMMIAIFASLIVGVFFLIKKKKINPLFYISAVSVLFSIGYLLAINNSDYRYLLPLTGFALFMLAFVIHQLKNKKFVNGMLVLWIISGAISLYDFKNYSYDNKPALTVLIDQLEKEEISHVYCEGGLLQWQIMFYAKEQIIARYTHNTDRYPRYIRQVDKALKEQNEHTALVGGYQEELVASSPQYTSVNTTFFIYKPVDADFLKNRGFDLTKPE